jgi:ABC-type glutathione transport system ATPase component
MSVRELLAAPLRIHRVVPESGVDAEVRRIMALVGLSADEWSKYPGQLSGGQYQRIIIARAIATQPRLIVCDEPVSALDVSVQGQILNLLASLKRELDLTYLFISHDLAVIRHICDRVAVMNAGRIVEIGPTDEVLTRPRHSYTRKLVAELGA